jgi:hypothetical protein
MPKAAGLSLMYALISGSVCLAQTISGFVATPAGEPVRGATLRLSLNPSTSTGFLTQSELYSVFSDAKGNYAFEDLAPGRYAICSDKPGYLYKCYADSAKRVEFELAPGQRLTGIDIKMTPQAVISGRITDENGDPYPNLRVETAQWSYGRGGRQLKRTGGAGGFSNAEGDFSIGGLEEGSYYLQVQAQGAIPAGTQEAYLATYYPGVTDPLKAVAVQVPSGGAVRGIQILMNKTRAYRVRGRLAGIPSEAAPQAPAAPTTVRLTFEDNPALTRLSTPARDGAFDFSAVLPGAYVLEVRAPAGFARQRVIVGSADVDGVLMRLAPYAQITGTISIAGAAAMNGHPTVQLISADGMGGRSSPVPAGEDGTFAVRNLMPAAKYHVEVQALPLGTYVKSIRFGGRDVTKTPFDLTSGNSGMLNIVLSPNAGEAVATVHDADGLIRPSAFVSLWTPGLPAEGAPDFTKTEVTDRDGKFTFTNLPPGEYRVAAWEGGDQTLYQAMIPEVRAKLDSTAAAVKLDEGARVSVDVPIIGRGTVEAEAAKLP